ncbi:MAG: NAD-dependent epimerase/dehydratase family protein [Anaerolineae bacterium]
MAACLVTGATGAIGPSLVRELCARGYRVRALVRTRPAPGLLPESVEVVTGGLEASALAQAVEGVDVVFHLAALLHITNPDAATIARYQEVNVGGTEAVLRAAVARGVSRVVYFSTIAVYGSTDGRVVDESTPPDPDTPYASSKLAAERLVLAARRGDAQPLGSVLRLAAVYGPRLKGNYDRLVRALSRGRFIPVGDGRNRRTLVHVDDVIRAAVLAAEHQGAAGRAFNVTDGTFHTMDEITGAICYALDCRPPRLSLPEAPCRLAAGVVEDASRLLGISAPVRRSTIEKYVEDVAVKGDLVQAILGFHPAVDLAHGWQSTIAALLTSGGLA